jgi:hypothetical protein
MSWTNARGEAGVFIGFFFISSSTIAKLASTFRSILATSNCSKAFSLSDL